MSPESARATDRKARRIQASGTSARTGKLFDARMDDLAAIWADGYRPLGLYITMNVTEEGAGADIEAMALLRLRVAETEGGGRDERLFHLTRQGVWWPCSGWRDVIVEIVSLGAGVEINYAWTRQPPLCTEQLGGPWLLQIVAAGVQVLAPRGARSFLVELPDANWQWDGNDGTTAFTTSLALVGGGNQLPTPRWGQAFTPSVANVVLWFLEPL